MIIDLTPERCHVDTRPDLSAEHSSRFQGLPSFVDLSLHIYIPRFCTTTRARDSLSAFTMDICTDLFKYSSSTPSPRRIYELTSRGLFVPMGALSRSHGPNFAADAQPPKAVTDPWGHLLSSVWAIAATQARLAIRERDDAARGGGRDGTVALKRRLVTHAGQGSLGAPSSSPRGHLGELLPPSTYDPPRGRPPLSCRYRDATSMHDIDATPRAELRNAHAT
ncbi:hypothetical protein BJ912DRAFT_1066129 [Pholiota molesta]|nr:hypothetical protein BJ912DRAFT_1066129 [Pholiota molesta]